METRFADKPRPAAQAGLFYDSDPALLKDRVIELLGEQAEAQTDPLALLAPHAGYVYSGDVAGSAYSRLRGRPIDRVLLLGPSHGADFIGAVLDHHPAWESPLGEVGIDAEAARILAANPCVSIDPGPFAGEHALEVQLPFLQVALGDRPFRILPVLVGRPPVEGLEALADALEEVLEHWRRAGLGHVVVASSDTYHGSSAERCRANDDRLIELIELLRAEELIEAAERGEVMACGWAPLALTMILARRGGGRGATILARSDSRSGGGWGGYVVGYLGAAME